MGILPTPDCSGRNCGGSARAHFGHQKVRYILTDLIGYGSRLVKTLGLIGKVGETIPAIFFGSTIQIGDPTRSEALKIGSSRRDGGSWGSKMS